MFSELASSFFIAFLLAIIMRISTGTYSRIKTDFLFLKAQTDYTLKCSALSDFVTGDQERIGTDETSRKNDHMPDPQKVLNEIPPPIETPL